MSLSDLVQTLFTEGRIVLSDPVGEDRADEQQTAALLERAFKVHCSTIAGPAPAFDRGVALAAARFVARAAWFLVSRGETEADLQRLLWLPKPITPSHHLSGDLLLRYVPYIYRRARGLLPGDVLTSRLEDVLRRWPLSGVLADLTEPPLAPIDFGEHHGLLLLYAERLAEHFKPTWIPRGPGWPYIELVWTELDRDLSPLKPQAEG